jgi:hypothetical protein
MKSSFFNSASFWLLPGLIAGAGFLVIAMVGGALGTTLWALPDGIAQAVGMSVPARYGFALWPLLVGIAIHLAFSTGLGVIFIAITRWLRLHGWLLVVAALIFITAESAISIWGVLHNILPTNAFYTFLGAVPLWASILGRYTYGLILGLLLAFGPFAASRELQRGVVQH